MSGAQSPSRWFLYGPLIAGAVVILIYAALWGQGASQIRRSINEWAEDQRAAGIAVQYDKIATEGFPFFLRGAIDEVAIGESGAWAWRAPKLHIDALPLAPNRLVFSAREGHEFETAGVGRWTIDAPDGRASIESDKKRAWIVDIESGAGRIAHLGGDETISVERFLLTLAPSAADHDTIEASLAITDILAHTGESEINAPILEAMVAVRALSALELGPDAWRAAGGGLELRRISIDAEGASLTVSGELTLDHAGRPEGVLNAEAINPGAFAQTLSVIGAIDEDDVKAVAAGLTLAALAGGGKIKAPLVLKDGAARIAGIKVARLPSVY